MPLVACDPPIPAHVGSQEIKEAMVFERYAVVCRGLQMDDPEIRRFAVESLEKVEDPIATACICENALTKGGQDWDAGILQGLDRSKRDDRVACFLPGLESADTERVVALAQALSQLEVAALPSVLAKMAEVAVTPRYPEPARIAALHTLAYSGELAHREVLLGQLREGGSTALRAQAARSLSQHKDPAVVEALRKIALAPEAGGDADGVVRVSAMLALKAHQVPEADQLLCEAMLRDPVPEVRRTAILAYKGTPREEPMACLRERALTLENDGDVRQALLEVLFSSPSKGAPKILCDAIPFWVKSYVKDTSITQVRGGDIIKTQNDRDWQNSYDCVAKAYAQRGGYTCKGKQYVGGWFRELGNDGAALPKCPGDAD